VHLAIKVEKQMKRKSNAHPGAFVGSFFGWKLNYKREHSIPLKQLVG
jgi:hypothetical protein